MGGGPGDFRLGGRGPRQDENCAGRVQRRRPRGEGALQWEVVVCSTWDYFRPTLPGAGRTHKFIVPAGGEGIIIACFA